MEHGRVVADGGINEVVDGYLAALDHTEGDEVETEHFVVNHVSIHSPTGSVIKTFEPAVISVLVTAKTEIRDPGVYVGFLSLDGMRLAGLDFKDFETTSPMGAGDRREFRFHVHDLPLLPGSYRLELYVKDMAAHAIEIVPQLFPFDIAEVPVYGGRKLDRWFGQVGLIANATAHPVEAGRSEKPDEIKSR